MGFSIVILTLLITDDGRAVAASAAAFIVLDVDNSILRKRKGILKTIGIPADRVVAMQLTYFLSYYSLS